MTAELYLELLKMTCPGYHAFRVTSVKKKDSGCATAAPIRSIVRSIGNMYRAKANMIHPEFNSFKRLATDTGTGMICLANHAGVSQIYTELADPRIWVGYSFYLQGFRVSHLLQESVLLRVIRG